MRIRHDSDKVKEFSEIMLSKYYKRGKNERPKGFHRSDALACPLRAFWRMTGEIEEEYGTRDVGTLLLGTLAHIALHKYFDAQEKVYTLQGIYITVDAIYGKYPIETKTTRKAIYKKEDLLQSWIEQIGMAMAVMKVNKGYLMVMNIITYGLTVWEITMTNEEREMFLNSCVWQIISIADAIKKKNPSSLTPKYSECKWCPYRPKRGKKGCPYYKPSK